MERKYKGPAIGIDLGTTYSCVAAWKNDRIEIIPNDQGNRITPSCVAFTNEARLCGEAAKNQGSQNSTNIIFDAKRLIGRRFSDKSVQNDIKLWPFKVIRGHGNKPMVIVKYKGKEKQFAAEEISSMVLAKMREIARKYLDHDVRNAVITVPAYFNDSQRRATQVAGDLAGLKVMKIISEPTAAAISYGLDNIRTFNKEKKVLVFDLGGGTFDVSVLTIINGEYKVKATTGDTHLGGEDFNSRMVNHFIKEFERKHKEDISTNPRAIARLRAECEKAKRLLSSTPQATIQVDSLYKGIDLNSTISRAKFNELNKDFFKRCMDLVGKCLTDAKMDKNSINDVVLVGGSTRIPEVRSLLQSFFCLEELKESINADEAVAYGAAIQASNLCGLGNYKMKIMVLQDITPLSLGVEVDVQLMHVMVPKNTPIPARIEGSLVTVEDNQNHMDINVYQGQRTRSRDNHLLGKSVLRDIPRAPKGATRIIVCFEIDSNGCIDVSAWVQGTRQKSKIIIRCGNHLRSNKEIERMLRDAKIHEKEDEEYKKKVESMDALKKWLIKMNDINDRKITYKLSISERNKVNHDIRQTLSLLQKMAVLPNGFKKDELAKEIRIVNDALDTVSNSPPKASTSRSNRPKSSHADMIRAAVSLGGLLLNLFGIPTFGIEQLFMLCI